MPCCARTYVSACICVCAWYVAVSPGSTHVFVCIHIEMLDHTSGPFVVMGVVGGLLDDEVL